MMAAGKKNRRERRLSDGKQKKSSAKRASGPTSDAKWLQVSLAMPAAVTFVGRRGIQHCRNIHVRHERRSLFGCR